MLPIARSAIFRSSLFRSQSPPHRLLTLHNINAATLRRAYASEAKSTAENALIKEREAVKHHAAQTAELWRKLSIYVAIPALIITSINAWNLWSEHWEHVAHDPIPREEKPEYPYQNIRTKNYFWGDGDKTLFWNDNVNYHKRDE